MINKKHPSQIIIGIILAVCFIVSFFFETQTFIYRLTRSIIYLFTAVEIGRNIMLYREKITTTIFYFWILSFLLCLLPVGIIFLGLPYKLEDAWLTGTLLFVISRAKIKEQLV